MDAASLALPFLIALIAVALAFDFLNGMNDAANSIATSCRRACCARNTQSPGRHFSISSRSCSSGCTWRKPSAAVSSRPMSSTAHVIFGALAGAIVWQIVTPAAGHSIVEFACFDRRAGRRRPRQSRRQRRVWSGVGKTAAAIFLSPGLGLVLALMLMLMVSWIFVRSTPHGTDNIFAASSSFLRPATPLAMAATTRKRPMGIIAVLLYSQGSLGDTFTFRSGSC